MKLKTDNLRTLLEQAEAMGAVTCSLEVVLPDHPGDLLTMAQAARRLRCSISCLRKKCKRKAVRYYQSRPHAPIYFRAEWLEEYNRSAKHEAPSSEATARPHCGLNWFSAGH